MKAVPKPLTNLQIELLKIFSLQLSENELKEIRDVLAQFFAKKAMDGADAIWQQKGWTKKDETRFLKGHKRTSYKAQ